MSVFSKYKVYRFLALIGLVLSLNNPVAARQTNPSEKGGVKRGEAGGLVYLPIVLSPGKSEWSTVAANPERTSWTSEQVTGDFSRGSIYVEWYRPIEAYIPQNVQIIASNGLLYISTARGLYALDAANGDVRWRYDTELPLGNSPTVYKGVVYVGGFDRKIHALKATDGTHLWAFEDAQAGYSTNPLVVNDMIFAGNRDGYMYAIGAQGVSAQGQLLWKYKTGGPIFLSAAYKNGVVYFASNDNYAYALNANTGTLVWKSNKLPGDGYQSFWPVVYTDPVSGQDRIIFSMASGYRHNAYPGTNSILCNGYDPNDPNQYPCDNLRFYMEDLFYDKSDPNSTLGPTVQLSDPWAQGKTVVDFSRVTEFLEDNPNLDTHLHKPWRRFYVILNADNGSEYTFDSDYDGYGEYAPIIPYGTRSGNFYPPLVGKDSLLYFSTAYEKNGQGRVMGWRMGTPYLSVAGGQGASDEPQAISSGGDVIYRSICCDRVGDWFSIDASGRAGLFWEYTFPLTESAPGYDEMWWGIDPQGLPRLVGNYGTKNGIYNEHGDQNPIVPYQGRVYIHRSNAIIAFGPGQGPGKLPLLQINPVQDNVKTPTLAELKGRLEVEIQKMIAAGHLRPGYYNDGQFNVYSQLNDYFNNPGDTIYTVARAFPYLSSSVQQQAKAYLKSEFQNYFDPVMYARIGWVDGAARESFPLPPEVESSLSGITKSTWAGNNWSWQYPQYNFYAMWKYAQIFPEDAVKIYDLAKSVLEVPVSATATEEYFMKWPWEHNAYIAGYFGFLKLQELAGKTVVDNTLRAEVNNELNRLLTLRASTFTKDTYWLKSNTQPSDNYHLRALNVARNFMMLVPELGDYLNQNALTKVQSAVDEYNFTGPYWFVARYNGVVDEGVMQNLYDYPAMFQAKAYILKESRAELTKYLDVAAFERGDLFYIQNLIAAIEAP